jgi:hypothetical protein
MSYFCSTTTDYKPNRIPPTMTSNEPEAVVADDEFEQWMFSELRQRYRQDINLLRARQHTETMSYKSRKKRKDWTGAWWFLFYFATHGPLIIYHFFFSESWTQVVLFSLALAGLYVLLLGLVPNHCPAWKDVDRSEEEEDSIPEAQVVVSWAPSAPVEYVRLEN